MDSAITAILIFGGMWLVSCGGIAIFIVYKILSKYNNFGDTTCTIDEYSLRGIHYTRSNDEITSHERTMLFANYGDNPYAGIKHDIPEQLRSNLENDGE